MGTNVTSSSGSVLEEPEIQKLQMQAKIFKENSLNKLNALKSTTQLLERQSILYQQAFAQLFGDSVRTFKFQLSQHMNNLETLLNEETLHEMDSKSALSVIKVQFERFINSDLLKPLDIYSRSFSSDREVRENFRDYTKMTAQTFKETIIQNMNSIEQCIIERASHEQELKMTLKKLSERQLQIQQCKVQEVQSSVTSSGDETSSGIVSDEEIDKTKDVHAIKYKMSKAKERCMAYFRSLHSHLQVLSNDNLKGTHIEYGFKRAFMSLFGQDVDTFTSTMLLNVDQLQKQLDKDEFQEDGSMAAFWVKSVAERTRHQRQYERRVNKRQMQTQESKIDMGKALDADLVDTESIKTDSTVQDDSSRSGNDTDADDVDIRPIYDEEPMAEVQLTAECNIFAIGQQHTEQPEIIVEGRVDQSKTIEQTTSLLANNAELKAQIQEKILTRDRLFPNKTSTVYEKTSSRSDLRWKPTGRIFKTVGLRWIPTGKLFNSCTTKVDSEPPHGSNVDIPNIYVCKQTLDLSAVSTEVHQAAETVTMSNELDLLFDPLFDEYFNGENHVVLKASAVTTTDASNKRQQQHDSTSSTSTLATTVTANGNFDFIQSKDGFLLEKASIQLLVDSNYLIRSYCVVVALRSSGNRGTRQAGESNTLCYEDPTLFETGNYL
ncbi:hypothetical protein Tco_1316171 [Tanacetum coccineum]